MNSHVLVVDDDPLQCRTAELVIAQLPRFEVTTLTNGKKALEFLARPDRKQVDVVLLDLSMPEMDGMTVLRKIHKKYSRLPVIIYTAHADVKAAVKALQEGAVDFVEKQDDPERLKVSIQNAVRLHRLKDEVSRLQRTTQGEVLFSDIIGRSDAIEGTKKMALRAADSDIPVLVKGESGVGKEVFARAIHSASTRRDKPFIAVNCGAIPDNLVESILFGHEKGAFTGAVEKTLGKFREADGGTLFLDEIGELRPEIQVKLLRALQTGEVEPVGAGKSVKVDVRIISATNVVLKDAVAKKLFREDLYYRLNVFPITIPPLRERKEDITPLLNHFCHTIAIGEHKEIQDVTEGLVRMLEMYHWPGNVRQLENAVYRAVVMCEDEILDVKDFAHIIGAASAFGNDNSPNNHSVNGLELCLEDGTFKSMSELEEEIIRYALEHMSWRISKVARTLNIGRSTLYRKMEEYSIQNEANIEDEAV